MGVYAGFRCDAPCDGEVLLRGGEIPKGLKGVYVFGLKKLESQKDRIVFSPHRETENSHLGPVRSFPPRLASAPVYFSDMRRIVVWFWLATATGGGLMAAEGSAVNSYVDARVCASCHATAARNYLETGMGRSFFRPTPANTVEAYTGRDEFYHALSDTHYSMTVRDGVYYQRRWTPGFGGTPAHLEESRIDYVIGSGNHSRSYLHRTPRGTLIELPLSWYSEKGGHWGMSPGFDSLHPPTRRLVSYECIFCHDAYPRIPAGHDAPGSEPIFSGDLPQGIDCQRCHGPGARHVAAARTAARDADKIRGSIVNPLKLPRKLRMDICLQCHLEPTSTAIPSLIRRFNRGPFSFTAGEPLADFLLAFDHAPGSLQSEKFEIVGSSAYRLLQSRCFLESKEAMTCETCHNPHRAPARNEAAGYYSEVCRGCHAAAVDAMVSKGVHPAAPDCVGCHMPKRRTEDVVHVVMTDHLIQRRPRARDLLAAFEERHPGESEEYRGEVVPYYPATLPRTGPDALYRALAQVTMKNNLRAGVAEFGRLMAAQQPREPEWHIQLGDARLANGELLKAIASYQSAVRLRPQMPRALQFLARGLRAAGQLAASMDALRKAVEIAPSDGGSWYQLGVVESDLGRNDEAIEKLRRAINLDPDLPGVQTTLGRIQLTAGQLDAAKVSLVEALRIDPYESTAWDLAGRVLTTKGEFPEALCSANEFDRAEEHVRKALGADAQMPEAHALLGGLLARKGQLAEATSEYREAVGLRPELARTRLDLASVLAAQGKMPEAVEQLRMVVKSDDAEAARLAADALRRLGQR